MEKLGKIDREEFDSLSKSPIPSSGRNKNRYIGNVGITEILSDKIGKQRITKARITKARITKFKNNNISMDNDECDEVENDFIMINQPVKINRLPNSNQASKSNF